MAKIKEFDWARDDELRYIVSEECTELLAEDYLARAQDELNARQQRFANIIRGFLQITAEKIDGFFECCRNGINEPWMPGEASNGITCKAQLRDDEFVLVVKRQEVAAEPQRELADLRARLEALAAEWAAMRTNFRVIAEDVAYHHASKRLRAELRKEVKQ